MSITSCFIDYEKPDGSIEVRAHILSEDKREYLENLLVQEIPDCYITQADISAQINRTGLTASEILQSKLPDPGSVMSGDFGELITLFYLSEETTVTTESIKKWRYKQDRNKPAPHSDVVIIHRKHTDRPSKDDFVICAEAKARASSSQSEPIESAVRDSAKDKTGRLARTLVWLKDKAIAHENADTIKFIKRFTDDLLNTEFKKHYKAVAIIDRSFLDEELLKALEIPAQNEEFEVLVLGITDLKALYENSFSRAVAEVSHE